MAQDRKGEFRLLSDSEAHELYVAFNEKVLFQGENYNEQLVLQSPDLKAAIEAYQLQFEKGISVSEVQLLRLSEGAIRTSGNDRSVQKLKNILKVWIPNPTNDKLLELAKKLESFTEVDYCALESLKPVLSSYPTFRPPQAIMNPIKRI